MHSLKGKAMNLLGFIIELLEGPEKTPSVKVLKPVSDSRKIRPDSIPLYIKRGWFRNGNTYQGYYRTAYGAWKGKISRKGDIFEVLIFDPPVKQLEKHPKWICFNQIKGRIWNIHLQVNPKGKDVGSIIFYIEKIIIESHRAF